MLIYVDTRKQVGDPEHPKVLADAGAAETWFGENHAAAVSGSRLVRRQQASGVRIRGSGVNPLSKRKKQTKSPATGRALDKYLQVLKRCDLKRGQISASVHLFTLEQRFCLRINTVEKRKPSLGWHTPRRPRAIAESW